MANETSVATIDDFCTRVCDSNADKAAWLSARRSGIGASEMPALFGADKNRGPLWLWGVKTGQVVEEDIDDVPAVYWGRKLEDDVLEAYGDHARVRVEASGILYRSKKYPWALATLDGWAIPDGQEPYPVEAKTTASWKADEWVNGAPMRARIQAHQQMLVTGRRFVAVPCLIGAHDFVYDMVHRDEALISQIIRAGEAFWPLVESRKMPSNFGPGAESVVAALWPKEEEAAQPVRLPSGIQAIADAREAARMRREEADREYRELSDRIKALLGPSSEAILPSGDRFTFKTVSKKGYTVDAKSYRELRFFRSPGGAR